MVSSGGSLFYVCVGGSGLSLSGGAEAHKTIKTITSTITERARSAHPLRATATTA